MHSSKMNAKSILSEAQYKYAIIHSILKQNGLTINTLRKTDKRLT